MNYVYDSSNLLLLYALGMCDGLEGKKCDKEGFLVPEFGVNTLADCVAKCNNHTQCSYVSHSYASNLGGLCFLYYKCNKKVDDDNFSSQRKGCPNTSKLFIK